MATHTQLPRRAYLQLTQGTPVVLVTVGADGYGNAVMGWAAAVAPDRVRFTVDLGTHTYANVQREGRAALHVSGEGGLLLLLKGPVRQVRERITSAPFGMAMWEMAVEHVRDQAWEGVIVAPYAYRWVGPQAETLRRVERAVLDELRTAEGGEGGAPP